MTASSTPSSLPQSELVPVRRASFAWLLPVLALVLSLFLVLQLFGKQGLSVTVTAEHGHGVRAGDALRFRGIEVGRVGAVHLADGLGAVELDVRLNSGAEGLARAGSRFWIVRPHLTLDSIEGLETVVGARYLSVLPGPASAQEQLEFEALEEPPVTDSLEGGGLEVVLEADERHGLATGAPVTYRGIQVGTVLSVGLSSDGTIVEVRAHIHPTYATLVREGTRFWEVGGLELGLSITGGLEISVDSVRSILVGGVAFATPDNGGAHVSTGKTFKLHADPLDDWLKWKPALALGSALLPEGSPMPRPIRAVQRWKLKGLITRKKSRPGWLLAVDGGVIGPRDLLTPKLETTDAGTKLEVRGQELKLDAPDAGPTALVRVDMDLQGVSPWDLKRTRKLTEPEACLIVGDPGRDARGLSASRIGEVVGGAAEVNDAIGFDEGWHGATVVARSDGAIVGLLLVQGDDARIAPLP
jgi:paraquat-inducible protein B